MSISRRRLSPDESRSLALDAARALLLDEGPQAVTLKAVALRVGRTHANLLHHFGSAAGLQRALVERIADEVSAKILTAISDAKTTGNHDPRVVVDLAFDAFDSGGAGALASWMMLTGNADALDPIFEAIHGLVDEVSRAELRPAGDIADETLQLVLMALGDALFGAPMAAVLGVPRGRARELAGGQLHPPVLRQDA